MIAKTELRCWPPLRERPSPTPIADQATLPPSTHLRRLSSLIRACRGIWRPDQNRIRMVSMAFVYLAELSVLVRIYRSFLIQQLPRLNDLIFATSIASFVSTMRLLLCLISHVSSHTSINCVRRPTDASYLKFLGHGRQSALVHQPLRLLPLLQAMMGASSLSLVPHLASSSQRRT